MNMSEKVISQGVGSRVSDVIQNLTSVWSFNKSTQIIIIIAAIYVQNLVYLQMIQI